MYYVYLIVSKSNNKLISYVGYTIDLKKRIIKHNTGKGAKFTKGRMWKLIYAKIFFDKKKAMKEEFKLKRDYNLRNKIKKKYIKDENINITTL
jgi:putative endonuclease